MRTIETTAVVTPEHTLTIQLPADVPPGTHQVVVIIGGLEPAGTKRWLNLKPYNIGLVDPNFTFRREDLYGDGDR
jgi:hypothetical protein